MLFNGSINSVSDIIDKYVYSPSNNTTTGGGKSKSGSGSLSKRDKKITVDEMIFKLIKKFKKDFNKKVKKYGGDDSLSGPARMILPMGDLNYNKSYELGTYNEYERDGF